MISRTNGQTDGQTDGQKKFSSLTFISMTHITIKTIRHIVSETQTDRQRQFIIIYIYICEITDIVDNISVGLKYRGNNKKTLDNGGKLSCLFTNTSSDPELKHAWDLNR